MKKLVAICSIFALVIGTASCNSDDNGEIRVKGDIEGTWYADQAIYYFNGEEHNMNFILFPGDEAVYDTDKLVITDNKVVLYEHKKNIGKETQTTGTIEDNKITFEKYKDQPREITRRTDKELRLKYFYTYTSRQGAEITEPLTITYSRVKPVFVPKNK